MPAGKQFASGSSLDWRFLTSCSAQGSMTTCSPGFSPLEISESLPPLPSQTPERSGVPSASFGAGPVGAGGTLRYSPAPRPCASAVPASSRTAAALRRISFLMLFARLICVQEIQLMAVRKRNHFGRADARIILGLGAFHRNRIALLDRVAMPSVANEDAGAGQFEVPVHHLAAAVFHVQVKVGVRIGPFHFRDHAGNIELLIGIELGRAGMMRKYCRS